MGQYLEKSLRAPQAVATFLGGLGALGLCLAGIGLYAVSRSPSRGDRARSASAWRSAHERRQVVWTVARDVAVLSAPAPARGWCCPLLAILALRAVVVPTPGISCTARPPIRSRC